MDNATRIKLAIGAALGLTWVLLVVFHVQGADDLITYIKGGLAMLGGHTLTMINPTQQVTK